jgi:hypothetical protein
MSLARVKDIVDKVRSKNAGPFWLTIDIFCGSDDAFAQIVARLDTAAVARLYAADTQLIKRFDIPDLNVVKFSIPRPAVQGAVHDRDMHGASWASLLAEMAL